MMIVDHAVSNCLFRKIYYADKSYELQIGSIHLEEF